jgi:hypothetical protein
MNTTDAHFVFLPLCVFVSLLEQKFGSEQLSHSITFASLVMTCNDWTARQKGD